MDEETLAVFERLIEAVQEVNASVEKMEESIVQSIEGSTDAINEKLDAMMDLTEVEPPPDGDMMDLGQKDPWDEQGQ